MFIRPLRIEEIGGARVRQKLNSEGRAMYAGEEIPLDKLATWCNRDKLIERGIIEVWPKNVSFLRQSPQAPVDDARADDADMTDVDEGDLTMMVIPRGFGKYDVVEGREIAKGVTKDEAHAIAGTPRSPEPAAAPGLPAPRRKTGAKHRRAKPRSRSHATAPEPKMPDGIGPKSDEPNGPVE